MRIVIDARYLSGNPSGIAVYSENLLRGLAARDRDNDYFCLVQPGYRPPAALGVNFYWMDYPARPLSFSTLFSVHRMVNRLKPDLLHTLFPLAPVFYPGKLVATAHDLQPLLAPGWTGRRPWPVKKAYDGFYRWIYRDTFRRASFILCVSDATAMALAGWMPKAAPKIRVTLEGVDPNALLPADPEVLRTLRRVARLPARFILYLGSTRPNKNLPAMLRAFARARESNPALADMGFVLVLTQDRFFADVEEVIARDGLRKSAIVLPPVNDEEKRALIHQASALFFCAKFEGFGHPVLEAQAQGTPVVASTHAALPETGGDGALYADPDDVEAMANALARALTDESLRASLIEKGRANLERFSWDEAARVTLEAYVETASRKK